MISPIESKLSRNQPHPNRAKRFHIDESEAVWKIYSRASEPLGRTTQVEVNDILLSMIAEIE